MFRKFREAIRNYTIKRDEKKILRKSLKEWINESGIDDQKKRNRKEASNKIIDVYINNKTQFDFSEYKLNSLPKEIGNLISLQEVNLFDNDLVSLPKEIENLISLQKLSVFCNNLNSIPKEIGNLTSLQKLDLGWNNLTSLPEEIGNLTLLQKLHLSKNKLTSLPETIVNLTSLQKLDLAFNKLTSLPETIGNLTLLQEFSLVGNDLKSLPETIVNLDSLQKLLIACNPSIPNTPNIIEMLQAIEQKNSHNPEFILTWPENLDRNASVGKIKQLIKEAYTEYYSSNEDLASKVPDTKDLANYPTLYLTHRFMSESIGCRGGIDDIVAMMMPVAEKIKEKPSLLEFIDPTSSIYLDACINQPVAGFTEISNMIKVANAPTIPEKLEAARVIMAINLIREEVRNLNFSKEVEAELANAMLRDVHKALLNQGIITEEWPGIPKGIAYQSSIEPFLTDTNIQNITEKVTKELQKPLAETEIVNHVCEGTLQDFWANIILDKEDLEKLNEDVLKQKDKIKGLVQGDPADYLNKLAAESALLKNLEKSSKENILKASRAKTDVAIKSPKDLAIEEEISSIPTGRPSTERVQVREIVKLFSQQSQAR